MSPTSTPTTKLSRYTPRVQVWANGAYLYRVHSERADFLLHAGHAELQEGDKTARRIWRIHLRRVASSSAQRTKERPTPASVHQFKTQAPVYYEVLGYKQERLATYSFHRVNRDDQRRIQEERKNLKGGGQR